MTQINTGAPQFNMNYRVRRSIAPGARAIATSSVTVGIALEDWNGRTDVMDTMATGTILAFVSLDHRDLSATVQGSEFALVSTSTGATVSLFGLSEGDTDVRYLAERPFNLGGQDLTHVRAIFAENGKWSIDEEGKLIVQDLEVKGSVKVGTPTNRTGVTLYDETDGSPYCIKMVAGVLTSLSGECGNTTALPTVQTPSSQGPETPPVTNTDQPSSDPSAPSVQGAVDTSATQEEPPVPLEPSTTETPTLTPTTDPAAAPPLDNTTPST